MFTFGKRILLLVLLLLAGMAFTGILSFLISSLVADPAAAMRMSAVVQDLCCFVLPAVILALLVTRLPADFLQVRGMGRRSLALAGLTALTVVVAVPLVNSLVQWNEAINLGPLQQAMRGAEDAAAASTALMLGNGSVADLVLGLLIVGLLAGFSEEIFFRGALQRLLLTRPMNPHAAIWITAVAFSAFHMQFFGFVPRMLLGALFGYAAWWSGSLWPAVIGHIVNNSLTVTVLWLMARGALPAGADSFGAGSLPWTSVSVVLVVATLAASRRLSLSKS